MFFITTKVQIRNWSKGTSSIRYSKLVDRKNLFRVRWLIIIGWLRLKLDLTIIVFGYLGYLRYYKSSNDEPSNEESENNLNDFEWFEPPPLPLIHFDVVIFVPPSCKDKCAIHFDWGNHPHPCKHGLLPRNWLHSSLIANLLGPTGAERDKILLESRANQR